MLDHCDDPELARRALAISEVHAHPLLPRSFYDLAPVDLDRTPARCTWPTSEPSTTRATSVTSCQGLLRLRQHEREHVRLHVYTTHPRELTLQLARLGLAGTVPAHPYRPVLEFLNLTTQFDVLVVDDARTADCHDVNPYLPSKVADYVGSGTPVWAIYEPGSVLSSLQFDHRSSPRRHRRGPPRAAGPDPGPGGAVRAGIAVALAVAVVAVSA